jgi:hypothetical protein
MSTEIEKLVRFLPNKPLLLESKISLRISEIPDLACLEHEMKRGLHLVLNGLPYFLISFEGCATLKLQNQIQLSLININRKRVKFPVHECVITFDDNIYVFFIKKHSLNYQTSLNKLSNRSLIHSEKIFTLYQKSQLNSEDLNFLNKTINDSNLAIQSLSLAALLNHNIYQLPDALKNQFNSFKHQVDYSTNLINLEGRTFLDLGILSINLAQELESYLNEHRCKAIDISHKTDFSNKSYYELFIKDLAVSFLSIEQIFKAKALISIGLPDQYSIYEFLVLTHERLEKKGRLFITTEMISTFYTPQEQKKNFLLHRLLYLLPLICEKETLKQTNILNGNDLMIYSKFKFDILTAIVLIENNSLFEAELLLKNLFTFCNSFLEDRVLPPVFIFFQIALSKLKELLNDLDQNLYLKTNVKNFKTIAEAIGFKLIKHNRILPTHGNEKDQAGIHFFVLEKSN